MFMTIATFLLVSARKAFSAITGFVTANPWPCAVAASLALAGWQWSGKQHVVEQRDKARAALSACKDGRKADREEWDRKVAAAKAVEEKAKKDAKDAAQSAQETVDTLSAANDGLRAYIERNRLRAEGRAAVTASPDKDQGPAVPDSPPASPLVAISESDLKICDADYVYAAGAFDLIQKLVKSGLAQ